MVLLRLLRGKKRGQDPAASALLSSIAARVPPDGAPGLLPAQDPAAGVGEERQARRFAEELHRLVPGGRSGLLGQSRRLAAIASAARRRSAPELEEALRGVAPWALGELVEELLERRDLDKEGLAAAARELARRAADPDVLAGAIAMIGPGIQEEDRELLLTAGRSPALAGICAQALEHLPFAEADRALLALAEANLGLGRALVLERLAARHLVDPEGFEALTLPALELAASIEDPLDRAWAAVPLLEVARLPERLSTNPELAAPAARCLEAVSRGGWNGGPGPGLARLPGATRAAESILRHEALDREVKRRTALAVIDARPIPPGPAHGLAEALLADGEGPAPG